MTSCYYFTLAQQTDPTSYVLNQSSSTAASNSSATANAVGTTGTQIE